jgi:hypothetical protein
MPLLYMPHVFTCIIAFIHFGFYCILIIVNILPMSAIVNNRTMISRLIWASKKYINILVMCLLNIVLFVCGIARMKSVINGKY